MAKSLLWGRNLSAHQRGKTLRRLTNRTNHPEHRADSLPEFPSSESRVRSHDRPRKHPGWHAQPRTGQAQAMSPLRKERRATPHSLPHRLTLEALEDRRTDSRHGFAQF